MRSVLLTLMVSLTQVQFPVSCPASCIVCSEDAIICNKLSSTIEAPDSTKALMLIDGLIDTVGSIVFSDSSNMSVLALSNNVISTIMDNAFQNLTVLRTLILDHNRLSNQALDTLTFSWLRKLETLHLGNNALKDIDGSWFQSTKALKTLLLEGNLLTSLNSSTFASSDLRNLEILDLSDNLIAYLGRNSFRNLPRLRSLDLSRNRLQNAPDAFSYLSWLSMLNLDLNRWNCTCELRELASFLNSYVQSPDKVLYNGQRMACVSSDNPAVQTVLELTEANCVPANSNITVTVTAKSSITPQRYVRDVAITAICFFLGGVGITLGLLALVYRKLGKNFKLQEKNEAEEQSSQASAQWDFSEDKEALSMAYSLHNSNHRGPQPWNKENTSFDVKSVDNHFICPNCSSTTLGTGYQEGGQRRETLLQRDNHRGLQHKREDGWSTPVESDQWNETEGHSVLQSRIKDIRAQRQGEKRNGGVNLFHLRSPETVPHGVSKDTSTIRMEQLALRRHISVAQRQTFTPKEKLHPKMYGNPINNHLMKHQHEEYGTLPVYQTINCLHCHQTYEYRQTGNENQDSLFRNHTDTALPSDGKVSESTVCRDSLHYNQTSEEGPAKEQRSVTFDLSGSLEQGFILSSKEHEGPYRISKTKTSQPRENSPKSGKISSRRTKGLKSRNPGSQLSRKLKVKLNLNPLKRNRVHSTSSHSHEDDEADGTSIKAKKGKNQKRKDDAKEKSKTDKARKKPPWSGSKAVKKSKRSDSEEQDEAPTVEQDSEKTPSKRTASKKNDQESSRNNKEDVLNDQSDTNYPADGEIQCNNSLMSANTATASSSESQILQNSAVPLTHSLDLSAATVQPLSMVKTTDPQQATNPDLNLPVSPLENIGGPQEEPTGSQEVGENSTTPVPTAPTVVQEYLSSGDGSPKRRIRLIIPEKTSNRPQTALERKIR
ncbi:uncharacterized protein lrrc53 [Pygocentrus nattereri]|uniref:LRRCT domain-containing protein n=1 Tax=Pygocentrus nattereri TaxID=42514 RepID=A0A3B4EPF1_PYGNA|nr:uncharacterized protein lrrc53 [Pygocentrus nattereri]